MIRFTIDLRFNGSESLDRNVLPHSSGPSGVYYLKIVNRKDTPHKPRDKTLRSNTYDLLDSLLNKIWLIQLLHV